MRVSGRDLLVFTRYPFPPLPTVALPSAATAATPAIFSLLQDVFGNGLFFWQLGFHPDFLLARWPRVLLLSSPFTLWFYITTFRALKRRLPYRTRGRPGNAAAGLAPLATVVSATLNG